MAEYLTRKEKRQRPRMADGDPNRPASKDSLLLMGRVEINNELCNGCKLCVEACPASTLKMTGRNSVAMTGVNPVCVACSDCVPICLPRAITLTRFQNYQGLYKFIGRGEASAPRRF